MRKFLFIIVLLSTYVELVLGSRAYVFQTFSVSEVLGASKMNQIEANIRDHVHGAASVSNPSPATQAEAEAATSDAVTLTPNSAKWYPGIVKAVVKATVAAGVPTLVTPPAFNITSITDTATGRLTVTIATDFSSANWCCIPAIQAVNSPPTTTVDAMACVVSAGTQAAGSVVLDSINDVSGLTDPAVWHMIGVGDQ